MLLGGNVILRGACAKESSAIVAGGLAGLFLLAFLSERASKTAAYIGIAASLVFTAWATLTLNGGKLWDLGRFNFPLHDYMIGVIGHIVLLTVGYTASFPFPNGDPASKELTLWGWRRRQRILATPTEIQRAFK